MTIELEFQLVLYVGTPRRTNVRHCVINQCSYVVRFVQNDGTMVLESEGDHEGMSLDERRRQRE